MDTDLQRKTLKFQNKNCESRKQKFGPRRDIQKKLKCCPVESEQGSTGRGKLKFRKLRIQNWEMDTEGGARGATRPTGQEQKFNHGWTRMDTDWVRRQKAQRALKIEMLRFETLKH